MNHGADVNATNKYNETALLVACQKLNAEAINVLLNARADPTISDYEDYTCLHHGGCSKENLQAMIHHGADVNATNKNNITPLMHACENGDIDAINILLNAGADPNIADVHGYTALHDAVEGFCSTESLRAIIDHGADVNARNNNSVTAIMIACYKGNTDAISVLLKAGADLNMTDGNGASCIHHVVGEGFTKAMLETVINHGADVNLTNNNNATALMIACLNSNVDAINVLLNAGADSNIADADGDSCLHNAVGKSCIADPAIAAYEGYTHLHHGDCSKENLQAIIDHGVDINASNKMNVTALMVACQRGNTDVINILLNAGADPNIADEKGAACIHHAVGGGCRKEVLLRLISRGADVNATTKINRTALKIACLNRNEDAINVLLNAGADSNIADADGDTCLHTALGNICIADPTTAAYEGYTCLHHGGCSTENLQVMIDHGADVNALNNQNATALMIACHKRNTDAINVLLNAGADPNIADDKGATCIHHAVSESCSKDVLETIINQGEDANVTSKNNVTASMTACLNRNEDAINVLLNAGANTNIIDADGDTCLQTALGKGCRLASTVADYEGHNYLHHRGCSIENLQAMIDHGANVNATNKMSETALMLACQKQNIIAMRVLLDPEANPDIADVKGDTLLHNAIQKHVSKETLHAIIDHGVDVNAINHKGESALLLACETGQKESVSLLLRAGAYDDTMSCLHKVLKGEYDHEILQMLLDHGVPVNAANKNQQTAYMLACHQGNIDAMCTLVNAGADPNIKDSDDKTCLHRVVHGGSRKYILQAIIDHGADVNAVNNEGATVLMLVCEAGQKEVVNIFLRAEADTSIVDVHGDTCLHKLLHRECDQETLQMLLDHGVPVNATNKNQQTAYMLASHQGNIDAMCALVDAGADPNITDSWGNTSLHLVAQGGSGKHVLEKLMEHGANVYAMNNEGSTALMLACGTGEKKAVDILLRTGADTSVVDIHGDTCLHNLVSRDCDQDTLQMLLNHGVPVNVTNKNHQTAYMLAYDQGNVDAMHALVNAGAYAKIDSDDDDTNISCGGCCSNLSLQTIVQWLTPAPRQDTVTLDTSSPERFETNNSEEFCPASARALGK